MSDPPRFREKSCGCKVFRDFTIEYCLIHAAAPRMLTTLQTLEHQLRHDALIHTTRRDMYLAFIRGALPETEGR